MECLTGCLKREIFPLFRQPVRQAFSFGLARRIKHENVEVKYTTDMIRMARVAEAGQGGK